MTRYHWLCPTCERAGIVYPGGVCARLVADVKNAHAERHVRCGTECSASPDAIRVWSEGTLQSTTVGALARRAAIDPKPAEVRDAAD